MVDNKSKQQVEVIHTLPKLTTVERLATEKRISSDLHSVLSEIYEKLNIESE